MIQNIFVFREGQWFVKGRFFEGKKALVARKDGQARIVRVKKIVNQKEDYDIATFEDITKNPDDDHGCTETDLY